MGVGLEEPCVLLLGLEPPRVLPGTVGALHPLVSFGATERAAQMLKQTCRIQAVYWIPSHHVSEDESPLERSNLSPYCPV